MQEFIKAVYPANTTLPVNKTTYYLFGERQFNDYGNFHSGVDVAGQDSDEIRTLYKGEVVFADGSYGTVSVKVPALNNIVTNYVHMKNIRVSVGDIIEKGTVIGQQSNVSTESIGSHLHFEVRVPGSAGPAPLINNEAYSLTNILPYGYMDGKP